MDRLGQWQERTRVQERDRRQRQHIAGLDLLRFVAALLVVVFHFGLIERHFYPASAVGDWAHFGWVGVQVFFVLSGFVIAFSAQGARPAEFFVSRFVRLVPGVWVCAPLSLIVAHYAAPDAWNEQLGQYVHSILFDPFGPWIEISYWTLGIEVAFYAAVLALIAAGRFRSIRTLAIAVGCASAAFWIVRASVGFELDLPGFAALRWFADERISALLLVHHGVFFAVGVMLWSLLVDRHPARTATLAWIALFSVAGCLQVAAQCAQYNEILSAQRSWTVACAWWLASLAFIVFSIEHAARAALPERARRAIALLARIVYPLYLINFNLSRALYHALAGHGLSPWQMAAIALAAALALALLVAQLAERPLQRLTRSALRALLGSARTAPAHTKV